MKKETMEFVINVCWIVAIIIIVLGFFILIGWINTPTNWSFTMNMDDNTLEAIKTVNWSDLK